MAGFNVKGITSFSAKQEENSLKLLYSSAISAVPLMKFLIISIVSAELAFKRLS